MGSLGCLIMAGIILSDVTGQDLSLSSQQLEEAETAAQEEDLEEGNIFQQFNEKRKENKKVRLEERLKKLE